MKGSPLSLLICNIHVATWPFYFIVYLPYLAEFVVSWFVSKIKIKKEDVASAVKVVVGATLAVAGPVLGKIGIDELKKKK